MPQIIKPSFAVKSVVFLINIDRLNPITTAERDVMENAIKQSSPVPKLISRGIISKIPSANRTVPRMDKTLR